MVATPLAAADREATLLKLGTNARLAHQVLFEHRHPQATPDFHFEIIDDWHGPEPRVLDEAFRGAGKSTLAEEAVAVMACFQKFRNCVVLGSSAERANDRLRAIKHEIEHNEIIGYLFGSLVGPTWNEDKVVLSNGACIQAFGRGQSMRGVKHLDARPDLLFIDDLEEKENVKTPAARQETLEYLFGTVLPALEPTARVRMAATPLDPEALPAVLAQQWKTKIYPVEHVNDKGDTVATWPERYPLDWIAKTRADYERLGRLDEFMQEYMCVARDPTKQTFTAEMIKTERVIRTWQRVDAFYDPARTAKSTSASTGKAVFSWIGNRLVVWEGSAHFWMPDAIVNDIFKTDEQYGPAEIGIEETGLNEFLMQPLRAEMSRRRVVINLKPYNAPKGKLQFIEGLQPFFKAGEVVFTEGVSADARAQLLGFPTGRIDFPNALAYALRMRPGLPIYDNFNADCVVDEMRLHPRAPLRLVVGATGGHTAAALVQLVDGTLRVVADWMREGPPGGCLAEIVAEAKLEANKTMPLVASPKHFIGVDAVGLRAAARKIPCEILTGGEEGQGREEIRALIGRRAHGQAGLLVSIKARWTLGALSGGYCRAVLKGGGLSEFAEDGVFKTLMEAIESMGALIRVDGGVDAARHYDYTDTGRRYLSAMPGATRGRPAAELKRP